MQRGVSIVELVIVILILGVLTSLAAPKVSVWSDRLAVLRAVEQVAGFHRRARLRAVLNSTRVKVAFSAESLTAIALGPPDSTILSELGPARLGVSLTASRNSIRLYPNGLGLGAANTKIVLEKGEVAGSLTVSRLGRLKRWR